MKNVLLRFRLFSPEFVRYPVLWACNPDDLIDPNHPGNYEWKMKVKMRGKSGSYFSVWRKKNHQERNFNSGTWLLDHSPSMPSRQMYSIYAYKCICKCMDKNRSKGMIGTYYFAESLSWYSLDRPKHSWTPASAQRRIIPERRSSEKGSVSSIRDTTS